MGKHNKVSFDPIESAKILSPERPPQREVVVNPPQPVVPPVAGCPTRFRVVQSKQVSLNGTITTLGVGKIVSDSSYGPGMIERLKAAGVKLEPVD